MRGLYVIADLDALERRGLELLPFAEAVLAARPAALQLRAKTAPPERAVELLRLLRPACTRAGVPLVANDRIDVALGGGADMLHVGQKDAPPSRVRAAAPELPFGLSTHTPEELSAALRQRPRYVAFGPVYPTRSKEQPDPVVGLAGLQEAAEIVRRFEKAEGRATPLVAIGGITLERAAEVARYAECAAVIADLLPPEGSSGDDAYELVRARAVRYADALGRPSPLRPEQEGVAS